MKTILISSPELDFLNPILSERYRVLRIWENPSDEELAAVEVVVCVGFRPLGALLEKARSIGLIACYTIGFEALELEELGRRGIMASNAGALKGDTCAEFGLALILAACRNIVAGDQVVRAGTWKVARPRNSRSLSKLRLGIVGMGAIGTSLAEKAGMLGMEVSWWGPNPKPGLRWPRHESLLSLAERSDVLAICARSGGSNKGMISAEIMEALGPCGILVNIARGGLVDEEALRAALREARLGGAALDVFMEEPTDPELWRDVPNVILTPHLAGGTQEVSEEMIANLMANIECYFAGRPLIAPIL